MMLLALLAWLIAPATYAATITWTGLGGDKLWSSIANWDLAVPVATNDVVFTNLDTTGSSPPLVVSNNIVDVSTTIQSLQYANINNDPTLTHTTYIPLGNTLSITGSVARSLSSGTFNSAGDGGVAIYATILGGGAIVISNTSGSLNVRQGMTTPSGGHSATLDMSGLNTFDCTVNTVLVAGDGGSAQGNNRLIGTLILGKTNTIRMTGSPGMTVGRSVSNSNLGSGDVELGQTNLWLSDSGIAISYGKSSGSMEFQAGLIAPVAVFRSFNGAGRMANWAIADDQFGAQTGGRVGNVDFSLGKVDAMVDTIIIGRGMNGGNTGDSTGFLTLSDGVIDANNVTIGTRFSGGSRIGGTGTVTVNNTAQFIVNSDMLLGANLGSVNTTLTFPKGILNINSGGFVWVKGNIIDGASPGALTTVNVNTASLKVGGQVGRAVANAGGLENLNLTSANLTLTLSGAINANNPVCRVTNLSVSTSVTLNVLGGNFGLGQYPLIQYLSGTIGGDGYGAFALGSLPPRTLGYLSNNTTASSIDLVVTNISSVRWNGNVAGGDWNINTTANWIDTFTSGATTYLENTIPGDTTIFDDSATGTTTVNLTTTLSPTSVTVSNASKTYIFKGPGGLSSSAGPLTKTGAASLIITNSGLNALGGGVSINGGLIQLGLAPNRLPTTANLTIANATGAGLDLGDQNQALNSLSGGGGSGGNVNLGAGTLTTSGAGTYSGVISGTGSYLKAGSGNQVFAGANLYGGGTAVNGGILTLDNATGSGSGTGTISIGSGGTLVLGNNDAAGSVPSGQVITNNGALTFNRSDDLTFPNLIMGTGGVNQNNTNKVTLATANSYSGQTTVIGGGLRVSHPNALGTGAVYVPNAGDAIISPTAHLEILGNINITNAILLDQKNAGYGVVPTVENISGINTLSGPMTVFLGGSYWRFFVDSGKLNMTGPVANQTSGNRFFDFIGAGDGEWFSGIPEGSGTTGLYFDSTGTWTLSGTNTYTGPTSVNSGKLIVNGQIKSVSTLEVFASAILGGTGIISSPITIDAGGTLAPGNSIGTLTDLGDLILSVGCSNVFEVNGDTLAHDSIVGMNSVTYGGTLYVNLSGSGTALVNGAALKLFDATNYSGTLDAIVPSIPSAGHTWNTETLAIDGTLRIGPIPPNITSISNAGPHSWLLSGTGEDTFGFHVLATTNLTTPLGSWWVLGSGTITGGAYSFTDTTATNSQRFYRVVTP